MKLSSDLVIMTIVALAFTLLGLVTGAQFYLILCGACLALCVLELVATRGKITE